MMVSLSPFNICWLCHLCVHFVGLCGVSNFRKYITVLLSRQKEQLHSELISQEQSHVVHFLLVDDPFHITHICTTYLAISFFSASCSPHLISLLCPLFLLPRRVKLTLTFTHCRSLCLCGCLKGYEWCHWEDPEDKDQWQGQIGSSRESITSGFREREVKKILLLLSKLVVYPSHCI